MSLKWQQMEHRTFGIYFCVFGVFATDVPVSGSNPDMLQRMDERALLPWILCPGTTAPNTLPSFGRGRLVMSEPSLCHMYLPRITMNICVCLSSLQSTCNASLSTCCLGQHFSTCFFLKPLKVTRAILAQLWASDLLSAQSVGFTRLLHLCLLSICGSLWELNY